MSTTTTTSPTLEDCEVTSLRSNGDHRLCLRFRDGLIAELDFIDCVSKEHGPQTEPLRDAAYFSQVWLDDGVLTWPNGYDIAPETLRLWAERGYCD